MVKHSIITVRTTRENNIKLEFFTTGPAVQDLTFGKSITDRRPLKKCIYIN